MENWKPVLVSVHTAERDPSGREENSLRLLMPGELRKGDGGAFLLRYQEQVEEDGAEMTQVHMRLRPGQVMMQRSGNFGTTMVFARGKRFEGQYHTPFGDIPLRLYTTRLDSDLGEKEGSARLEYRLEMGQNETQLRSLRVSYRETV